MFHESATVVSTRSNSGIGETQDTIKVGKGFGFRSKVGKHKLKGRL